ncbi:MAG TPA: hypothetical protein VEL11_15605 [Candidatus Bathyarchaeia archaeon]|nr:hypothetical protein [Candidatus Bathyarchaeia archaeon]
MKHHWSEICMPSRFHTNDKSIIVDNYDNALGIIKQKLYDGDYFTSTDSSINITYNRTIHRYQVFPSKDISTSIDENPRSKESFNTIRLLDIPTSSDDFDRYIESQIALNKLNTNLSEDDYKIEQENELKKKLIDSIVYLQSSRKKEKECAYFEYDNGNSKIATTCISTLKQKYEKRLNHEPMSIEEVQRLLLEQDIPIEITKELAVIILRDCFSAAAATIHL